MQLEDMMAAIKDAMDKQRLSARDVAERTGKSEQEIGRWLLLRFTADERRAQIASRTRRPLRTVDVTKLPATIALSNLVMLAEAVGLEVCVRKPRS